MNTPQWIKRYFRRTEILREVIECCRWIGAGGLIVGLFRPNPFDALAAYAVLVFVICFIVAVVLRSKLNDEAKGEAK